MPAAGPELSWPKPASIEFELRSGDASRPRWLRRLSIFAQTLVLFALNRTNGNLRTLNARRYRRELSQNSDFRKYDDGLKLTIDVSRERLSRIEQRLEEAAGRGICRFGLHRQDSALITCFVPQPFASDHLHFIDGAAGGYAMAAAAMKAKAAAAAA